MGNVSANPSIPEVSRRRFLFALSAGGAGAVAAAATPALAAPADAVVATPAAAGSGYRETQHVRDYYATTRL
ncbi:MAG: formate dehydrogenase [Casimicrobiaceae bacterium]